MNDKNTKDLYNNLILKHYKNPYHKNHDIQATHTAHSKNESCGDEVTLDLKLDTVDTDSDTDIGNAVVTDVSFQSKGCIICQASASILAKYIEGKRVSNILSYSKRLKIFIGDGVDVDSSDDDAEMNIDSNNIDDNMEEVLRALAYVREFPTRTQCVLLSWNTLERCLKQEHKNS